MFSVHGVFSRSNEECEQNKQQTKVETEVEETKVLEITLNLSVIWEMRKQDKHNTLYFVYITDKSLFYKIIVMFMMW